MYYFSTYLLVQEQEWARFKVTTGNKQICSVVGDYDSGSATDHVQAACSGLIELEEGECALVDNENSISTLNVLVDVINFCTSQEKVTL